MIASACGRVNDRFGGQGRRGKLRSRTASIIALVGRGDKGYFGNSFGSSGENSVGGNPGR